MNFIPNASRKLYELGSVEHNRNELESTTSVSNAVAVGVIKAAVDVLIAVVDTFSMVCVGVKLLLLTTIVLSSPPIVGGGGADALSFATQPENKVEITTKKKSLLSIVLLPS